MRKQLWSAFVSGWALSLLWSGESQAQVPVNAGSSYEAAIRGSGEADNPARIVPVQYQQQPGGQLPPAFEPYQGGPENAQAPLQMPPLNPYPANSPYDNAFDQHFNEGGLWFRRTNNGPPKFYTTMDFWAATLKSPQGSALIGAPVQSADTAWDYANLLPERILDAAALAAPDGYDTTVTSSFTNLEQHVFNTPQNLQGLNPDLRRLGMRFAFGVVNPDYTGMEVAGFFLVPREQGRTYYQGTIERSPDPDISNASAEISSVTSAIAIPNSGRLTFDEGFNVTYNSQAWSAEVNMFGLTPIDKDESMFLRTIFGVRYYGNSNAMNVYGQYSSLDGPLSIVYTPNEQPAAPAPQLPTFENSDAFHQYVPRSSFSLSSKAVSHLVGPQIGIQPELGNKGVKVTGWMKFAPMANFETVSLSTQNYGLPFTDGAQSASYKKSGVHFSSLVNAGAMIQAPVFKYIPWINTVPVLKEGTLRFGFDWVYTSEVAQAEKSVKYYAPLPKLVVDRTEQSLYGFFGGIGFTY